VVKFTIKKIEGDDNTGRIPTYNFLGSPLLVLEDYSHVYCGCWQPLDRAYIYTISRLKEAGLLKKNYKPMCCWCYEICQISQKKK
jgi:hypothetical protein